jgi:hypothetical protein
LLTQPATTDYFYQKGLPSLPVILLITDKEKALSNDKAL